MLFALGLSATVAPLTATVLADADESNAGIASGVNNAIARVAGLLAVAALGAVVAGQFGATIDAAPGRRAPARPRPSGSSRGQAAHAGARQPRRRCLPPRPRVVSQAAEDAAVHAFHRGAGIAAALVALGGVLGAVGIRNPRREVPCEGCPGGQLRGGPARGRAPAPGGARADVTRRQYERHATPIACCAAAHGRHGRCPRAGPARGRCLELPRLSWGAARRWAGVPARGAVPALGTAAMGAIVGLAGAIVLVAAERPSILSGPAQRGFPSWMVGPLAHRLPSLPPSPPMLEADLRARSRSSASRGWWPCCARRGSRRRSSGAPWWRRTSRCCSGRRSR